MTPEARAELLAGDRRLLDGLDAAFAESARLAGAACACRPGCTECCQGPFPITALDGWRLREGVKELRRLDPARAASLLDRAQAAVVLLREDFPGDPDTGILGEDDQLEKAFCERHSSMPCPALDPATGHCDLYAWRPVSCRTYGPPIRFGEQELPPCRLWLAGGVPVPVSECRVEPDPDDRERELLELMDEEGWNGETFAAFVLASVAYD